MNSPADNSSEPNLKQYQDRAMVLAKSQPAASLAKKKQESNRDTVEGIVIALVMVFLFRAFVAEAFIIPTGSMAETLYGRHKDLKCEKCKIRFRVGASEEVDRVAQTTFLESDRLRYGYCPNCRYKNDLYKNVPFKGDRIFVNKFPYEFGDPQRFDVVVFKFPEDPKTSYIKRLIGLPGEIITISRGDLYQRMSEDDPMQILRKPYHKQKELHQLVYDNDHPVPELLANGYPERWESLSEADWKKIDADGWKNDAEKRTFKIGASGEPKWLRYRHFVPTEDDWVAATEKRPFANQPAPILIADFYSYNSGLTKFEATNRDDNDQLGEFWVGDLIVSGEVKVDKPQGELALELVESRRQYRCDIDLKTGQAKFYFLEGGSKNGEEKPEKFPIGEGETSLKAAGTYRISFANVDDRVSLWVNDELVRLTHEGKPVEGTYENPPNTQYWRPTEKDMAPVGIGARDAEVEISHLRLDRDVYYTQAEFMEGGRNWRALLSDPERYGDFAENIDDQYFILGEDEFFVLGDNSPRSLDSRLWRRRHFHPHAVPRSLMMGKAFFIFWPHGIPVGNNGEGYMLGTYFNHTKRDERGRMVRSPDYPTMTFPFYPQFDRMRRIR